MIRPETLLRLVRYGLIGLAINGAGYLAYLALTFAAVDPTLAMSILYVTAVCVGFVGNRQWAFRHSGAISMGALLYLAAHAGGYAINFAMLAVLSTQLGYPHQLIQAAAIPTVAIYLFLVLHLVVFRAAPRSKG